MGRHRRITARKLPIMLLRRLTYAFALAIFSNVAACHDESPIVPSGPRPVAVAPSPSKPIDRLAEGELAPGTHQAFGFVAPRDLHLDATFPDSAHFSGQVDPLALASYVKERVSASSAEVAEGRTTYERVRILAGDPKRVYKIDILSPNSLKTLLILSDLTPPQAVQGLSVAERWQRAGMTANGQLLDPMKQE